MAGAFQALRGTFLPGDPGVLDMGAVNVHVVHGGGEMQGGGDPGVAEYGFHRHQIHPAEGELAGAQMAQNMHDVGADCAVGQPRRRPSQQKPGQHVGLEPRQLLLTRRCPRFPQVSHYSQAQPGPPRPSVQPQQHRPDRHRLRNPEVESEQANTTQTCKKAQARS
jgi:hypothetical protein